MVTVAECRASGQLFRLRPLVGEGLGIAAGLGVVGVAAAAWLWGKAAARVSMKVVLPILSPPTCDKISSY